MYVHDYDLTDEQEMFRDTIRKFMKNEIIPVEMELDPDATEFPADDVARLQEKTRAMGMFNPGLAEEYGGSGLDFFSQIIMSEETAKHRQGLYNPAGGAFGWGVNPLLFAGNDDQKEKYLLPSVRGEKRSCFAITEVSGGSDPARDIQTRAVQTDGGWILNGTKFWISNAGSADFVIVFVRTDNRPIGEKGDITIFIVDVGTPGFTVGKAIPVIRPLWPYELIFDDCFLPDSQLLGEPGGGFTLMGSFLTGNRISYAAKCVGIAQEALEMAVEYSKIRETFGKFLSERQGIQWMLADSATELHAARLVVYHAAAVKERGLNFQVESSMAKVMATEVATNVVDKSIQVHGGMGLAKELPLERWYREMRTRRIGEGPSEVMRHVIARNLLY
ncbi:MAG: acyl-CoA dehydrogenase family protein [Candidatus Adiutricales bacterium]